MGEYAVDNKEARMLIEIESAIDESEEDDVENDDEDEDDAEDDEVSGGQRHGGGRGRGVQRRRKARVERRWRKLHGNRSSKKLNFKKRNAAKLEARKRRRLAKKLRKMMD